MNKQAKQVDQGSNSLDREIPIELEELLLLIIRISQIVGTK